MQLTENTKPAQTLKKIQKRSFLKILGVSSAGLGLGLLTVGIFSWQLMQKRVKERTAEVYYQAAPDFTQDKYLIKIKGVSHRKIKFCEDEQSDDKICKRTEGIELEPGGTYTFDLSGHALEFGDVNLDGVVGVNDYSAVKACRNADAKIGDADYDTGNCKAADANLNGVVESADIDLLFKTLSENPDDE
jgi:hypothetical protein